MPGSSDVRAGGAFVELYVRDNLLTRGLNTAVGKFTQFGGFLNGIITRTAGLAGLIAAPIGAALHQFVEYGSKLSDTSDRIGATVEDLDALSFAAEQGGASFEDLTGGLEKLNKALGMANAGSKEARAAFEGLGLSAEGLSRMGAADQLAAIADALDKLPDQAARTRAAMQILGKGGGALLPMLKGGGEAVRGKVAEAQASGLVMSDADARRAEGLGDAFAKLKAVLSRTFMSLGAALLPVFEQIQKGIERQLQWAATARTVIRENEGLILSALKVAKTVAKVAAAAVAVKFAFAQLGTALGIVSTVWGAVASAIGFVLSPLGLVLAAVVGLTAAFIAFTPAGQAFRESVGGAFAGIADRALEAWDGIKAALQKGDLQLAARVAWTGVQVEALRVWKALRLAWSDVVDFFADGWDSAVYTQMTALNAFADAVEDAWNGIVSTIADALLDLVKLVQDNTRGLREALGKRGISTFEDMDTEGVRARLKEEDRLADRAKQRNRVLRDKALGDALLDDPRAQRERDRADLERRLQDDIDAKDRERRDAIAQAKGTQGNSLFGLAATAFQASLKAAAAEMARAAQNGMTAVEARGAFGGALDARSLGLGSSLLKDIAQNTEDAADGIEKLNDKLAAGGGLAFGT